MTAQEKIWKIIRGLGEFTTEDVVVLTELQWATVSVYLSTIHKAGYLRITGKRGHQAVYRIIKNTGPKAPIQRRCLYDPNTKKMIYIERKEGNNVGSSTETNKRKRS